ncbi:hypothetical protein ACWDU8_33665, partial [Streptomyces sp. NPDC003388]
MPHSQTSAHRDSLVGARLARGASPWLLPTVATAALSLARARRSGDLLRRPRRLHGGRRQLR